MWLLGLCPDLDHYYFNAYFLRASGEEESRFELVIVDYLTLSFTHATAKAPAG